MKRIIFILLIIVSSLIVFSGLVFASDTIDVKDYIKGKFPVIFNIYLAPLGELDEYEKEFIDLLQNLPEEEQKNFAKEVYNNGFSKEILEKVKKVDIKFEIEIEDEEKNIEELLIIDAGKWIYKKEINPLNDKTLITFKLECEENEGVVPIFLILEKEGKKTTIYVDWGEEVRTLYEGSVIVRTRFGDKKSSKSLRWETSIVTFGDILAESFFGKRAWVPSRYTFYTGRESKFIRKLISVDRFVIEVKSVDKMKMVAVFDVRGLKAAVEPYNGILNWVKE